MKLSAWLTKVPWSDVRDTCASRCHVLLAQKCKNHWLSWYYPFKRKTALKNHKFWADRFFRRIQWWRLTSDIESGKMIKHVQTAKYGTCERLGRQWCHLTFMKGHANYSKCSWLDGVISNTTCHSKPIRPSQFQDLPAASNSSCLAPVT